MSRFVAIDVETANTDYSSICQVGIVLFDKGSIQDSWESLINPKDYFDPWHIKIHGIDESAVENAPIFPDVFPQIRKFLDDNIVVCHTAFDRVAVARVLDKYDLPASDWVWLDTAKVARRAWEQFATRGYGLHNLANWCGITFEHHNAVEDARAAGEVLLKAVKDTGLTIESWIERVKRPITPSISTAIHLEGNPEGHLHGEVLVFTGALSMPRRQAAELAANAGCDVERSVTKRISLLVIGDQDARKQSGHKRSTKHRKAEALRAKGSQIRFITESDFFRLVEID